MTTPREALIERIRKLRAMTVARGCTEAEAASAAVHVARLCQEFFITQDELSIRAARGQCIQDNFGEFGREISEWHWCALPIAKLCHCKAWHKTRQLDPLDLGEPQPYSCVEFFGFAEDVAAAVALCEIIYTAIATETLAWTKQTHQRGVTITTSFRRGMVARLCERLAEMANAEIPQGNGRALVVVKSEVVAEEFAKLGLNLYRMRDRPASTLNGPAFAAGKAVGSRVDLSGSAKLRSSTRSLAYG